MVVCGYDHTPPALPPEMARYPLYRRLGGSVWTGVENLALTRIQSPDCPTRKDLPSRLHYSDPQLILNLLDAVFVT
jgi:hypothetical protein